MSRGTRQRRQRFGVFAFALLLPALLSAGCGTAATPVAERSPPPREESSMELVEYRFPAGAVVCAPGDYLACSDAQGRQTSLYRVQDLVLMRKLYPMEGTDEPTYFEAERLMDSAGPHYPDEIHLLLLAVDDAGATKNAASPIIRAASALPATQCRNLGRTPGLAPTGHSR